MGHFYQQHTSLSVSDGVYTGRKLIMNSQLRYIQLEQCKQEHRGVAHGTARILAYLLHNTLIAKYVSTRGRRYLAARVHLAYAAVKRRSSFGDCGSSGGGPLRSRKGGRHATRAW